MIACLRSISIISLAALLTACASSPSNSVGELPRTPEASIEQLLQQAQGAKPNEAGSLRLSAADLAARQGEPARAARILEQVDLSTLSPAQQMFASTLSAELAMHRKQPQSALKALAHPSFERLGELPVDQQVRTQLVKARALQADGQLLAAARERIFIAPLLNGDAAKDNHERIWKLVRQAPAESAAETDSDLAGWLTLAAASRTGGTLEQQKQAIDQWVSQHPQHPAALALPEPLIKLHELADQPLTRIALLLPQQGPLASAAKALRDGFLAGYYANQAQGGPSADIRLYDSSHIGSLDAFYQQAVADGIQLVVGPLDKPLVKQLSERKELPITTLALNYADNHTQHPPQLFQFGLAAEDDAREAARRAWEDGMRQAVALTPRGDWGDRVLNAFNQQWQALGGTLLAVERIDQPIDLAKQIAELFQLRASEARSRKLQDTLGVSVEAQPTRRQDIDFIFLAATPQQAQQIKPTLAFQYAGDVPVYATSHLFSGPMSLPQYKDLEGIRFCETPWLLNPTDPVRQQAAQQWPQAEGALGRLYAMGADAYRLAPRLSQLQMLPDSRIEGLTGSLGLGEQQKVERRLPWAEFRDGNVQRLPDNTL